MAEALARLVAPLVSFTAEEVWQYLPAVEGRATSVHLDRFPVPGEVAPEMDSTVREDWSRILAVRDEALKSLEEARQAKQIGKALDAKIRLELPPELFTLLSRYAGTLKEILNVSQVELAAGASPDLSISTLPADGAKCERCWNYSVHVGEDSRWPTVCDRCAAALDELGFPAVAGEAKA
jgi:isoleucyl-tRNA synthetase